MGRGKLNMELIRNEKSRNTTFQKRKKGLKKKTSELSTLCDIDSVIIIYGPNEEDPAEIWPEHHEDHHRIINRYRNQSKEERGKRSQNLGEYLESGKKKMEEELAKLRRQNDELAYPTWDDRFNDFSEKQLRDIGYDMGANLERLEKKIELMKGNQTLKDYSLPLLNQNPSSSSSYMPMSMVPVPSIYQRSIEQEEPFPYVKPLDHRFPMEYQSDPLAVIFDGSEIGNNNPVMPMMNYMDCTSVGGFHGNNQYGPWGTMQEGMKLNDPGPSTVCFNPNSMQMPLSYLPTQGFSSSQMHSHSQSWDDFYGLQEFQMMKHMNRHPGI